MCVMQGVFASGRYPVGWSQAAVSAVFKKGDPVTDCDAQHTKYRGTASWASYHASCMVLDARLVAWGEQHRLRAEGEVGFRSVGDLQADGATDPEASAGTGTWLVRCKGFGCLGRMLVGRKGLPNETAASRQFHHHDDGTRK